MTATISTPASWPMVSPLHQRMIDDMHGRKLTRHTERSHIHSCKRFTALPRPFDENQVLSGRTTKSRDSQ